MTAVERFIDEQLEPYLVDGEEVVARGYFTTELSGWFAAFRARAYYMALTNARLFAFEARVGALRPLLENRSTFISRHELIGLRKDDDFIDVAFPERKTFRIELSDDDKHSSTQSQMVDWLIANAPGEIPKATVKRD